MTMVDEAFVVAYEPALRLGSFVLVFLALAAWEVSAPRRPRLLPRMQRWPANLALAALNTGVLRLAVLLPAVGMASFTVHHGWGAFNHFDVPAWAALPLSVVALDFAIWLQHVM